MARAQDSQHDGSPPAIYDRDDHIVGVLASALQTQTAAIVDRLDGVTTELRSTREALVADSRSSRRLIGLAIMVVAAIAGVGVVTKAVTLTPPPVATEAPRWP